MDEMRVLQEMTLLENCLSVLLAAIPQDRFESVFSEASLVERRAKQGLYALRYLHLLIHDLPSDHPDKSGAVRMARDMLIAAGFE